MEASNRYAEVSYGRPIFCGLVPQALSTPRVLNRRARRVRRKKEMKNSTLSAVKSSLVDPVDLRLLQLVGVIHVNGFPLGVGINGADAAFAMAVAGGFGPAEGQVHFRANGRSVDVGDAGLEIADGRKRLVHVLGVER